MKYVIARYYFDSLFRQQAEENFFQDIQFNPVHRAQRYSYAVGHVKLDQIGDVDVIRGQIGRIPKDNEGFYYDTDQKDFIVGNREPFADIILDFCIIPHKKLLLIQQDSYFVAETALTQFKNIYLQSNQSYVTAFSVDFVLDEQDVYREISTWKRFTKASFRDLRRSNPDPNDDYADIENLIIASGGDRVNIDVLVDSTDNPETGGSLDPESTLIKQPLSLSSHGYGKGEITGFDANDQEKTVKTFNYKKTVDIDFREDGSIDKIRQVVEGVGDDDGSVRS